MPGFGTKSGQGLMLIPVKDEILVTLVENNQQVMSQRQVYDPSHFVEWDDGPSGVIGGIHDHRLGSRSYFLLECGGTQDKVVTLLGVHFNRGGSDHPQLLRKSHPIRNRQQHFVTLFKQNEGEVEERVFGA